MFGLKTDRGAHAEDLKAILGGLKGPLMKVAQFASTIPDALPAEYAAELAQLQANAPPMGAAFVRRRMAAELGPGWQSRFAEFGLEAAAAASLGQVHRARLTDGTEVACKLQYPDMPSVVEAEVSVSLLRDITTLEGATMRRFDEIKVVRGRTPLFFLTWTVMHRIDEASPLRGETRESLLAKHAEVVVVMKGIDETFVSTIHARTSYTPDEIVWGRRLADIFVSDPAGRRFIDFRRFHEIE